VTITDSLQRITGVQINRDAGVGTSVDVRGLPQVGTMMNGEVFISPDQIDRSNPTSPHCRPRCSIKWTSSSRPPRARPRAASAVRSTCTPIGPGICRMGSPIAARAYAVLAVEDDAVLVEALG